VSVCGLDDDVSSTDNVTRAPLSELLASELLKIGRKHHGVDENVQKRPDVRHSLPSPILRSATWIGYFQKLYVQ